MRVLTYFQEIYRSAVNANGEQATGEAKSLTGTAKLLDVVYLVCQNGDFEMTHDGGTYQYSVTMDSRSMEELLSVLAPDAADLDIGFSESKGAVTIEDDVVTKLTVSCGGSVKVLLTQASASVDADITFTDAQMPEVPDSVLSALR